MKIRLTRGAYTGMIVDHNDHVAHELVRRGLAELVTEAKQEQAPAVVETAAVPEPVEVERAVVAPRGRNARRRR